MKSMESAGKDISPHVFQDRTLDEIDEYQKSNDYPSCLLGHLDYSPSL
jgi:hypothetical protein